MLDLAFIKLNSNYMASKPFSTIWAIRLFKSAVILLSTPFILPLGLLVVLFIAALELDLFIIVIAQSVG